MQVTSTPGYDSTLWWIGEICCDMEISAGIMDNIVDFTFGLYVDDFFRQDHILPILPLPRLTTLTLICGRPKSTSYAVLKSLLDGEGGTQTGVLCCPNLTTLHLTSRDTNPGSGVCSVNGGKLGHFIRDHIQCEAPPLLTVNAWHVDVNMDTAASNSLLLQLVHHIDFQRL